MEIVKLIIRLLIGLIAIGFLYGINYVVGVWGVVVVLGFALQLLILQQQRQIKAILKKLEDQK